MMDDLVAVVIHDAKNALMSLDTQLAAMSHDAHEAHACSDNRRPASADFSAARATAGRIAAQLSELLILYRAQRGALRLSIDDHDLMDFLDDLRSEVGGIPDGLRFDIDASAAQTLGAWAFDAYLVKLALLDVIRNALRHAKTRVVLELRAVSEGGIEFIVADDGPGYPPAMLPEAGNDGQYGPDSTTAISRHDSTGLGLSFARLIATHHVTPAGRHGHVALSNQPGARFAFYLP